MFANLISKISQKISYTLAIWIVIVASILNISISAQSQNEDEVALCPLDDIHIQDMSSTVSGGAAGIENENAIPNPNEIITPALDNSLSSIQGQREIAVVVIDDFTTVIAGTTKTHGYYVNDVISTILPSQYPIITLDYAPDATLLNTYNLLKNLINAQEFDFYVVNMSWVVLPCKQTIEVQMIDNTFIVPLDVLLYRRIAQLTLPEFEQTIEELSAEIEALLLSVDNDVQTNFVMEHIAASFINPEEQTAILEATGEAIELRSRMNLVEFMMILGGIELNYNNFLAVRQELALKMHEAGNANTSEISDFKMLLSRGYIFPIAASGNFNLLEDEQASFEVPKDDDGNQRHDAFAPASWDEVLAVSGQTALDGSLWPLSHDGQVSAVSKWVRFDTGQVGEGTSFAAPQVTATVAWIAQRCDVHQLLNLKKWANMNYMPAIHTLVNCDSAFLDN